jgi:hypothetical protein
MIVLPSISKLTALVREGATGEVVFGYVAMTKFSVPAVSGECSPTVRPLTGVCCRRCGCAATLAAERFSQPGIGHLIYACLDH